MPQTAVGAKIDGNLDTNLLKLIAVISMFCDHAYKTIWPTAWPLAIVGRLAFPIFAYCLVVGCLYTSNLRRYLLRLAIFALISQPFYVLAFHPSWAGLLENFWALNIFFSLVVGLVAVSALKEQQWPLLFLAIAVALFVNIDYGFDGVLLMIVFYFFREKRRLSFLIAAILTAGNFIYLLADSGGLLQQPALQGFAVLSLPLIYLPTRLQPRIPKMFFYWFYPAHLLLLFLIQLWMR